jgi:metallo-beta-lactamase class B
MLAFFAVQAAAEPSRRPAMRVASIAEHQAQCSGKEGWNDPAPPIRIFGNVFDIGTCGITVLLIAGDKGAVIVDGATAQAAPSIIANVEQLGFKASDVKLLLSSHEHLDHAGGLNALQRWTNATMVGTAASKAALESGVTATDDPQRTDGAPEFSGIHVGRTVTDGEMVVLGSLRLTAHATPGHAPGGTSWSWRSCDRTTCHRMVYADSVSPVSADGYRFSRHPAYVATFRASLAKIAALTCDLVITPHPAASDLYERLAGRAALSSTSACASYAAAGRALLDRRLAEERAQTARP